MRLRPLTEAECYARCYGSRGGDDGIPNVRVLRRTPSPPQELPKDEMEQFFDEWLDGKSPRRKREAA